jgi:hypothetical protein
MDVNALLPELLKGFSNFTLGNGVMIARLIGVDLSCRVQRDRTCFVIAHRLRLYAGEHSAFGHDRRRRHDGRFIQRRHQNRIVPAADLHRRRRDDRFFAIAGTTQNGLLGAAGQFGIFGTLMLAIWLGISFESSRIHRRDRRD